jgi:hypothetical protein
MYECQTGQKGCYNTSFHVKYKEIDDECRSVFLNEPESLSDLDLIVNKIFQEELLFVLGNSSCEEEMCEVISSVWTFVKQQDRYDTNTILFTVCELHCKYSGYMKTMNEIDLDSKEIVATFTSLFSYHYFYILHKRICNLLNKVYEEQK